MKTNLNKSAPHFSGTGLYWNATLGSWFFTDGVNTVYARAAACARIPLNDTRALDVAACSPLKRQKPQYSKPPGPFNSSWPCAKKTTKIWYKTPFGMQAEVTKDRGGSV